MEIGSKHWLRRSVLAGVGLMGLAAAGAPGSAPRQAAAQAPAAASGPVVRVVAAGTPARVREFRRAISGMVVAIDPATGELRAPTQAEREALTGAGAARRSLAAPQVTQLPGGGAMAPMTTMEFLTAVRGEDGRLRYRCAHGLDAASPTFARDHQALQPEVR